MFIICESESENESLQVFYFILFRCLEILACTKGGITFYFMYFLMNHYKSN